MNVTAHPVLPAQDIGVDELPATAADCGCSPAASWFGHAAPLCEEQITHEHSGADFDLIIPDSLEQSSQDNQSQQPEQEVERDTMQEGFCYVVGPHALAYQVTGLQPDIAADSGVNTSTKQMHCQNDRVEDLSDGCVLCGSGTLFPVEVLPPLQLDLHQAEAALQTSIKGDDSSKVDACKFSTQQGTSSLSVEAHKAGPCKPVPEASPRQHWGRSGSDRAESDRAEPDRAQSTWQLQQSCCRSEGAGPSASGKTKELTTSWKHYANADKGLMACPGHSSAVT